MSSESVPFLWSHKFTLWKLLYGTVIAYTVYTYTYRSFRRVVSCLDTVNMRSLLSPHSNSNTRSFCRPRLGRPKKTQSLIRFIIASQILTDLLSHSVATAARQPNPFRLRFIIRLQPPQNRLLLHGIRPTTENHFHIFTKSWPMGIDLSADIERQPCAHR